MRSNLFLKKHSAKLTVAGAIGIAALLAPGYIRPSEAQTGQSARVAAAAPARPAAVATTEAIREAANMQAAFNQVARSVEPAVVTITTMESIPTPRRGMTPFGGPGGPGGPDMDELFRRFFGDNVPEEVVPNAEPSAPPSGRQGGRMVRSGLGSGFIIRQDGVIITNAHVVRGADTVTVKLADGQVFKNAKVVGEDAVTDVAVVKIPANGLPTVTLGDSDRVNVGDWAIALGNPFGLDHTMTVGVISAKGREVPLSENGPGQYLQTDASINPGNSGGPLLDIYGRVIGVNNAIYSRTGGNVGIGFAIPISTAREIADTLLKEGRVRRSRLGIAIANVSEQARAFGLAPTTTGALVESVEPNSPASRAGLEPGDVITGINGRAIATSSELQRLVAATRAGTTIKLDILRGGAKRTLEATVEERKEPGTPSLPLNGDGEKSSGTSLGIRIAPLTPDLAGQLRVPAGTRGVVVAEVQPNSAAQAAGIRRGDVIQRVGQSPIDSPDELKAAVERILKDQPADNRSVALYVLRQGEGRFVVVSP
ncbi:MAG: Do family serine endopeptidase [Capsulimonadales bacterium]|nr:Do family serine endopeptidase [Capsulimonadales bacterium]